MFLLLACIQLRSDYVVLDTDALGIFVFRSKFHFKT